MRLRRRHPLVASGHALARGMIRALENEQDDRAKVNGLFGSLNDWKG
jgi:hypothetical protein